MISLPCCRPSFFIKIPTSVDSCVYMPYFPIVSEVFFCNLNRIQAPSSSSSMYGGLDESPAGSPCCPGPQLFLPSRTHGLRTLLAQLVPLIVTDTRNSYQRLNQGSILKTKPLIFKLLFRFVLPNTYSIRPKHAPGNHN